MGHLIHHITEADYEWVGELLEKNKAILGGKLPLVRWSKCHAQNDIWVAIANLAFAHYRVKRDGFISLYEIAVAEDSKRHGLGSALVKHMRGTPPRPIELKTDADNEESNAFYLGLGMKFMGKKTTKSGKPVNLYMG